MATFKAVEYPNLQAAEGQLTAIYNYLKANNSKVDYTIVTKWCTPIVGLNGKALIPYDDRIAGFTFSPNAINDFDKNDLNYFPNNDI